MCIRDRSDFFGQKSPELLSDGQLALLGFGPTHEAISRPQPQTFAKVSRSSLVQAQNAVHAAPPQTGEGAVIAEVAVGQKHIPVLEVMPNTAKQRQFHLVEVARRYRKE